jgi:hypothetical protein
MVMLWGDVKETMEYPLTSLAKLAKENEHPAHMLLHTRMLWDMIKFLANVLQNNPDADKKYQRCHSRKLRQQPWHPVAGIVWSDKRCDSVFMKIMRKKEALELLLAWLEEEEDEDEKENEEEKKKEEQDEDKRGMRNIWTLWLFFWTKWRRHTWKQKTDWLGLASGWSLAGSARRLTGARWEPPVSAEVRLVPASGPREFNKW